MRKTQFHMSCQAAEPELVSYPLHSTKCNYSMRKLCMLPHCFYLPFFSSKTNILGTCVSQLLGPYIDCFKIWIRYFMKRSMHCDCCTNLLGCTFHKLFFCSLFTSWLTK
jgi:hypothetical protein